ncbi:HNH endonuclease [Acinetobacter baumannii]|uniref:HNH endonuclease n=1 Tax=Acinetobacter baumannii TaxID=470 RepID=UPI00189BE535|nr:HNH endonuclease [Acinetobacter baumannii]MBF6792140.1 HNH endonuclease [Acinetobacter baumannii]
MPRPCREFGCTNLVKSASQKGYCEDHAHKRSGWGKRQDRTGSTTERGYGHAWRKLRESILERDGYLCVHCRAVGRVSPATDVDHIKAKAFGGTDEPDNLQSLCSPCHKEKTAKESG